MRLGKAGYRAMAVDLRGHGDSSWDDQGNYGHDSFLEDLLGVVAHCGLEKPVLIGASLGGAVCLLAVGEGLVEASALALVDTAPNIEPVGVKNLRSFMTARPEGFERLEEVAESVAAYKGSGRRPKSLEGLAKNVRIDEEGRYHWHWDPRFMHRPSSSENWEERRSRLEACARRLALPTLLVRGGLSDMLSEKGARSFLELCPRSEYVSIDDAKHMVAGDHNDRFTAALLEFLNRSVSLGS